MHDDYNDIDIAEFAIVDEECYFCKHSKTILFDEHFIFCPNCSTIYTFMWVYSSCDHINDTTPVVLRKPWKGYEANSVYMIDNGTSKECSICGTICEADGW